MDLLIGSSYTQLRIVTTKGSARSRAAQLAFLTTLPQAALNIGWTADGLTCLSRPFLGNAGHLAQRTYVRDTFTVLTRLAGAAADFAARFGAAFSVYALLALFAANAAAHRAAETATEILA